MDRHPVPHYPMGQRFLLWLGQTAREMRVSADVSMPELAVLMGRKDTKPLERFERAENFPQSLEEVLAAYGELIGCDPRRIIDLAMKKWWDHGDPPQLASTLPPPPDDPPGSAGAAIKSSAKSLAKKRAAGKATPRPRKRGSRKKPGGA